jgi:hypothetical protein
MFSVQVKFTYYKNKNQNKSMTQKFPGVYSRQIETNRSSQRSIKIFNCLLLAGIIAVSLYYVTSINDLAVKGFKLQELKARTSSLFEENRGLSAQTTYLKSFNNLSARAASLNMVAVDNVDYLKVDGGVALAK